MKFKTNIDKLSPNILEYKLPSGGLFYPDEKKTVKINSFSFNTEEILLSNFSGPEKVNKIISQVTDFPEGFEPTSLMGGDQIFILATSRALTYNETYDFFSTCACGKKEKHSLKVPDQLPIKMWTRSEEDSGKEGYINISKEFRFQLPTSKDTIEIRYPTVGEVDTLQKWSDNRKNHKIADKNDNPAILRKVCLHIKSINGTEIDQGDYEDVEKWLRNPNFAGSDFITLRSKIENNDCGITQDWTVKCDSCEAIYTANIPINYSFFRRD